MSIEQFAIYSSARDSEKNSNRGGNPSNGIAGSSYRTASRQVSNFLIPEVAKTKNIETKKYVKHIEKITDQHFEQLHIYSPKMKKIMEFMKVPSTIWMATFQYFYKSHIFHKKYLVLNIFSPDFRF